MPGSQIVGASRKYNKPSENKTRVIWGRTVAGKNRRETALPLLSSRASFAVRFTARLHGTIILEPGTLALGKGKTSARFLPLSGVLALSGD